MCFVRCRENGRIAEYGAASITKYRRKIALFSRMRPVLLNFRGGDSASLEAWVLLLEGA